MRYTIVDTHCHIDLADFHTDRADIIDLAWRSSLGAIIIPAIVAADFDSLLAIADSDQRLHACCGLHPLFLADHQAGDHKRLDELVHHDSIVAIGECGLDYTRDNTDKPAQKALFEHHLELASTSGKPLVIHANKAIEDVILALQRYPKTHGVVHSFNGSLQQAERLIDLNFKLGFGGAITYPRATRLRRLVTQLPLSALLLETDAPFQTGYQHTNERNQPAWLVEVLTCIADLRQQPIEEVAEVTTATACELFNLEMASS